MKFPCRAFRSELAKLQQFIANPQQLLEGIIVDHHEWNSVKRPHL
jgi:hypothetical protein